MRSATGRYAAWGYLLGRLPIPRQEFGDAIDRVVAEKSKALLTCGG
jgi:hypothetical protein